MQNPLSANWEGDSKTVEWNCCNSLQLEKILKKPNRVKYCVPAVKILSVPKIICPELVFEMSPALYKHLVKRTFLDTLPML